MFCKWCGNKITENSKTCPICGKEQGPLQEGVGFWDLCTSVPGGTPTKADCKTPETQPISNPQPHFSPSSEKVRRRSPLPYITLIAAASVILVCSVAGTRSVLHRLETSTEQISHMDQQLQLVQDQLYQPPVPQETQVQEEVCSEPVYIPDLPDELTLQRYPFGSDIDSSVFIPGETFPAGVSVEYSWYISANFGRSWSPLNIRTPYLVHPDQPGMCYRLKCTARYITYIDLKDLDAVSAQNHFQISTESIDQGNRYLCCRITPMPDDTEHTYIWQFSYDGETWLDAESTDYCLIDQLSSARCRLAIITSRSYSVPYFPAMEQHDTANIENATSDNKDIPPESSQVPDESAPTSSSD